MDPASGSGTLEYMVEQFLPGTIMVVVSIALIAWMIRLGIFVGFRINEWRKGESLPDNKETMGLPKGAIRTFLVLTFTAMAMIAIFAGKDAAFFDIEDKKWILAELGGIITFYFVSKALESFVDSRAKIKVIEMAASAKEAQRIYQDKPTDDER